MSKKVIFLGTADFSKTVLQGIIDDNDLKVMAVVSQPDRVLGRKKQLIQTPVKQLAIENNLPIYQPEKLSGSTEMNELIALKADFIITAAYGQFLPTKFLDSAQIASINVHASLLPKYRGAAPINWAIINGDTKTGISIMYMVKEMDAGDVISTAEVEILESDTAGDLFEKLAPVGTNLLLKTIPKLANDEIKAIKQDEDNISLAPKIDNNLLKLDFYSQTAKQIYNLIRGLSPQYVPFIYINREKIKIISVSILEQSMDFHPGQFIYLDNSTIGIVAKDNYILKINELQLIGKKPIDAKSFINGYKAKFASGEFLDRL
ncbi:MAG: methionyl-tRNA formyltransferase [Lactobacillaceae bacterium]|jgi:methionyl-tRNA formyltransferase|nr:methionyl-tRNA formyltransferase [Lactobacillaceae bacterium]